MFDGGGAIAEGAKGMMTKLHRGAYYNNMYYIIYIIINPLSKALPQLHAALEFLTNAKYKFDFCNAYRFGLSYYIILL